MNSLEAEHAAFMHAICEQPDDDTVRLVFADWLEEKAGDAESVTRAEFIRVQIELAGLQCANPSVGVRDGQGGPLPCYKCRPRNKRNCLPWCGACERHGDLTKRERGILNVWESKWRAGPRCKACVCGAVPTDRDDNECEACHGTGDAGGLMQKCAQLSGSSPSKLKAKIKWLHKVEFRRGFPDRVEVPGLSDLVEERGDSAIGWRVLPTPWLAAVARHHPVSEIVPLSRVPDGYGSAWHWEAHRFPPAIFDAMLRLYPHRHNDDRHGRWCGPFLTRELAVTAGARAIAQFARGKVGVA